MSSLGIFMSVQRTILRPCRQLSIARCTYGNSAILARAAISSPIDALKPNHKGYPLVVVHRDYASKKGGKKSKGGVPVNTHGLNEHIDTDVMTQQMESAIETMKTEFVKTLSLRSAGSVESFKVKYEGKEYELQQIAKMTRKGQQTIVVDMLSFPQMTKAVMDALKTSALNLNPQQEGTTIFIPIPKVTKEHREILAKKAKALFITCRDSIKRIQENNIKELRDSPMPDSEKQTAYKQVRAIADKYVAQSETMMKGKQDELLGK